MIARPWQKCFLTKSDKFAVLQEEICEYGSQNLHTCLAEKWPFIAFSAKYKIHFFQLTLNTKFISLSWAFFHQFFTHVNPITPTTHLQKESICLSQRIKKKKKRIVHFWFKILGRFYGDQDLKRMKIRRKKKKKDTEGKARIIHKI